MPMNIQELALVSCHCKTDQSIGGKNSKTEFYSSDTKAAISVIVHVTKEHTHWCVHLNDEHIVGVKINNDWYGGFDKEGHWSNPESGQ